MPAIPEQQEIVRRTQSLFSLADQLDPARFRAQLALELQAGGLQQRWEEGEALWEAVG